MEERDNDSAPGGKKNPDKVQAQKTRYRLRKTCDYPLMNLVVVLEDYRKDHPPSQRERMKTRPPYGQRNRELLRAKRKEHCQRNRENISARRKQARQRRLETKTRLNLKIRSTDKETLKPRDKFYCARN